MRVLAGDCVSRGNTERMAKKQDCRRVPNVSDWRRQARPRTGPTKRGPAQAHPFLTDLLAGPCLLGGSKCPRDAEFLCAVPDTAAAAVDRCLLRTRRGALQCSSPSRRSLRLLRYTTPSKRDN